MSDLNYLFGERVTHEMFNDQSEKRYQNFSNIARIPNFKKRELLQPGSVKLQLLKKRSIDGDAEEILQKVA